MNWITVKENTRMGDPIRNAETGAIEWQVTSRIGEPLTGREIELLRRKHKTQSINLARAADVKRWISEGLSITEMAFRGKGKRGYCRRMIAADHSVLSAPLSKHKPLSR